GLQYGTDILATYGPLGFLTIPFYYPPTFPILIAFNLVVYVFMIARLAAVSLHFGKARYGVSLCSVCLPAVLINVPEWAPVLFVPYFLVIIYGLDSSSRGWRPGGWGTIYGMLLAAFTLAKLTFVPLILPIVVLCSIAEIGHGSFPKTMFVYAASL